MGSVSPTNSRGWTTQMKVANAPSSFTRCHLPTTSSTKMTQFTLRTVSLTPIVSCKRIWSPYTNLARVRTWERTTFATHFLGLAYLFWLWQAMLTNVDKVHRLKLINQISVKMSQLHNINSKSMLSCAPESTQANQTQVILCMDSLTLSLETLKLQKIFAAK